jgi:hypothetical protein
VKNPRHEAKHADGGAGTTTKKLPAGAPMAPTFRSVVLRSLMASAVFYLFLSLSGGSSGGNLVLVAVMFLFLLGFGYLFDRWFYRWRLRRWERKRAGG